MMATTSIPPTQRPGRRLLRWPASRLSRTAVLLGIGFALTLLLDLLPGMRGDGFVALQILLGLALFGIAIPLLVRFVRSRMLWSLRNKLIVTYLLVGLAPVVLVVTLVMISAYVAAGQFSIHLVDTRIQAELSQMVADNSGLTVRIAHQLNTRADNRQQAFTSAEQAAATAVRGPLPRAAVETFLNGAPQNPFGGAASRSGLSLGLPPWAVHLKEHSLHGVVLDNGALYLVAMQQERLLDGRQLTVLSSLPIDTQVMELVSLGLGHVRIFAQRAQDDRDPVETGMRGRFHSVAGGNEPPAINLADISVRFLSTLAVTGWDTGGADSVPVEVNSRPSLLYLQLFGASLSGIVTSALRIALIALCILFAAIEALALTMAIRLSRTMTSSVTDLYEATLRIDRGELHHRIAVARADQLAELSHSFNRMAVSLQRLIVEQQEKERLQNEIFIAQEVQANLFPTSVRSLPTLELHGICRPARSVSGDYYDFLVFYDDPDQAADDKVATGVSIALGDISGKGISAALLMATLHSAVRLVYSASERPSKVLRDDGTQDDLGSLFTAPGRVMSMLNRHLYRSTQPEKYATLFLAHYDAGTQWLTYSNAGQLPPLLLRGDNTVHRLDEGGTVVGLIDGMLYEEGRFHLQTGDILVAYSDGVTEPENEFGEFGEQRMMEVVRRYRDQPLHVISAQVMQALDAWIGAAEQPDDITLVLARQL